MLYRTADPAVSNMELFTKSVSALARLSGFEKRDPLPDSTSPVAVLGAARVMLYKEVDPALERERLRKEAARLEGEIAGSKARLGNASFVERAPAKVVEEFRARLAAAESALAKIRQQLGKLGA